MLNPHCLFAAAPALLQGLHLRRVGSCQLHGQIAVLLDMVRPVGALGPHQQVHGERVNANHLRRKHGFGFVRRGDSVETSKGQRHVLAGVDLTQTGRKDRRRFRHDGASERD
ncbi:hypothetical protein [Terrihabitans rhizophilus]|uniref:Secreted protein n=1 Tax=Terrihabitans rhizophilus TaxID=3092662 RepID=A0ABU4RQN3_9HYPH|nr:hypothetical protein [Terrihabitans sp. PJ23]MDX6807169.1 hypothetical protein [Terrihabitans sp. PJ23]